MPWNPTLIYHPDRPFRTATDTVRVTTDAGPGYLKALGNHGGPHLLAADWVATRLAQWMGLPTFEIAVINVTEEDEIEFATGAHAQPGPAFIAREVNGTTWGGSAEELENVVNPEDIARLVLFDTWTRNCDRHPPEENKKPNLNNVFFAYDDAHPGQFRIIAMDHTHCFCCGRDLDNRLSHIDLVQDDKIFGLFPEFKPFVQSHWASLEADAAKLPTIDRVWLETVVNELPDAWEVTAAGKMALVNQVCNRARYVADNIMQIFQNALN